MHTFNGDRPNLIEQAVEQLADMEDNPTAAGRARFAHWLVESRDHVMAVLLVTAVLKEASKNDDANPHVSWEHSRIRVAPAAETPYPRSVRETLGRLNWGAVGFALLIVGVAVMIFTQSRRKPNAHLDAEMRVYDQPGEYSIGPSSVMQLRDHSRAEVVHLKVRQATIVTLIGGDAFFSGKHDSTNPLQVVSGPLHLDVVGTEFGVYRNDYLTTVTVLNGEVSASIDCKSPGHPNGGALPRARTTSSSVSAWSLRGSEIATVDVDSCSSSLAVSVVSHDDAVERVEWTGRWLYFQDTSIASAVDAFNQRSTVHIVVDDSKLANRRMGGRFRVSEPDVFLVTLEKTFGAQAVTSVSPNGSSTIHLHSSHKD